MLGSFDGRAGARANVVRADSRLLTRGLQFLRRALVPVFLPEKTARSAGFAFGFLQHAFGLLLILGAVAFCPSAAHAQISPGPLARAHQSLSGSTQCNSCHQFGTATPTFKC